MARDANWWKSDEARDARVALYVSHLVFSNPENRRHAFHLGMPEWAAIFHYDPETDLPFWVEVKSSTHGKDFLKGCHEDHANDGLRKLAA